MNLIKITALSLSLASIVACSHSGDRPAKDPNAANGSGMSTDSENPAAAPGTGSTGSTGSGTSTTSGPGGTSSGAGAGTPSTGSGH